MRRTPADRDHWARSPNDDAFWAYRNSLISFIGAGDGEALDVGCGEGRVSRELRALGYHVTASDAVVEMIKATVEANSAHHYAVADAATLPFRDECFDLVVAYNVLMDVEDVSAALKEIGRVIRPGGELVVSIVHPCRDRGDFAGAEPDAPFVLRGNYLGRQRFEGSEQRNGLAHGFCQLVATFGSIRCGFWKGRDWQSHPSGSTGCGGAPNYTRKVRLQVKILQTFSLEAASRHAVKSRAREAAAC